jgi:hypothetical protein
MDVVLIFKFGRHLEKYLFLIPLSPAESIGNFLPIKQCAANMAAPYIMAKVHNFSEKVSNSMTDFSSSL